MESTVRDRGKNGESKQNETKIEKEFKRIKNKNYKYRTEVKDILHMHTGKSKQWNRTHI